MPAHRDQAAAAVPTALAHDVALVGPPSAIRDRLDQWRSTVVASFLVQGDLVGMRSVLEALALSRPASPAVVIGTGHALSIRYPCATTWM